VTRRTRRFKVRKTTKYGDVVAWEVVDEAGRVVGVYRKRKVALRRAERRVGRGAFVVKAEGDVFEVYGSKAEAEERLRELYPPKWVVTYTTPTGEEVRREFASKGEAENFMRQLREQLTMKKWVVTYTTAEGEKAQKEFKSKEEAERFARALATPRVKGALDAVEAKGILQPQPLPVIDAYEAKKRVKGKDRWFVKITEDGKLVAVKGFDTREEAEEYVRKVKDTAAAAATAAVHKPEIVAQMAMEAPKPWLDVIFPQLQEIRFKAGWKEPKPWSQMTQKERTEFLTTMAIPEVELPSPEELKNRLLYVGAHMGMGAAVSAAVTALTMAVPQVGVPLALGLLAWQLASLRTKQARKRFLDYVTANPQAFLSETVGGVLGSAAVAKLMRTPLGKMTSRQRQQYYQLKKLMEMNEDKPIFKTRTIPEDVADILRVELDPITGEEIVVGRLQEPKYGIDIPVARRYGGELFAKLMAGEELGPHLVEQLLLSELTPEQRGFLYARGYTQPILEKMTAEELARVMWKELGPNSPWHQALGRRGQLMLAKGRLKVIGLLKPLSEEGSLKLTAKAADFYNGLIAKGVDRRTALQLTQLGMEGKPGSAVLLAKTSGVSRGVLRYVAENIGAIAPAGSQLAMLKKMGLSDEEALTLQARLVESASPTAVATALKELKKEKELKVFLTHVGGTTPKTLEKVLVTAEPRVIEKAIPHLSPALLEKVVPKIKPATILAVLSEPEGKVLSAVVPKLTPRQVEEVVAKADVKTLTEVAPRLTERQIVEVVPKLDVQQIAEVAPLLTQQQTEILAPQLTETQITAIITLLPPRLRESFRREVREKGVEGLATFTVEFSYRVGGEERKVRARSFPEALRKAWRLKRRPSPLRVRVKREGFL